MNKSFTRLRKDFIIFRQATFMTEPRKGTFDDPSFRQNLELPALVASQTTVKTNLK